MYVLVQHLYVSMQEKSINFYECLSFYRYVSGVTDTDEKLWVSEFLTGSGIIDTGKKLVPVLLVRLCYWCSFSWPGIEISESFLMNFNY
jgi:hypothetical protein